MKNVFVIWIVFLCSSITFAEWRYDEERPTSASAQDLINAANAQKSGGVSAAEGFMKGYGQGMQNNQDMMFMLEMQRRQNAIEQERVNIEDSDKEELRAVARMPKSLKTGKDLLKACEVAVNEMDGERVDQADEAKLNSFYFLFIGVMHTQARFVSGKYGLCAPEQGLELNQAIRSTYKYLLNNPKEKDENDIVAIVHALSHEFPCKESNP